jgi:hypothetical protein
MYTDNVGRGQPIRAAHLMTTRNYLDDDISHAPPAFRYNFSWTSVSADQPILAKYYTEMHAAIQLLWDSKNRGSLPNWTGGEGPGGASAGTAPTVIRASHLLDLRLWLNQYEDNHSPSGVNSLSFDPNSDGPTPGNGYIINSAWVDNLDELSTDNPVPVRCEVRDRAAQLDKTSMLSADITRFRDAFSTYKSRSGKPSHIVYTLVTKDFFSLSDESDDQQDSMDFSPAPSSSVFINNYIRDFSTKCASVANSFASGGLVTDMIIWNEPNDTNAESIEPKYMRPDHFASMMLNCYTKIKAANSNVRVYWGGIVFGPGTPDHEPDGNSLNYIRDVYDALRTRNLANGIDKPWPWDGINIHIHKLKYHNSSLPDRTQDSIRRIFEEVNNRRYGNQGEGESAYNNHDTSALLVGEWGPSLDEYYGKSGPNGYPGDTACINNMLNWIKPFGAQLFLFTHPKHSDPGPNGATYALIEWTNDITNKVFTVASTYDTFEAFDQAIGS